MTLCPMRPTRSCAALLLSIGLWICAVGAQACPYCIREAGFIVRDMDPYRVVVFQRQDTPSASDLPQWAEEISKRLLPESNVAVEVVDLDKDPDNPLVKHLPDAGNAPLPAAVLVSPQGEAMNLDLPASPLTRESLQAVVGRVLGSEARDEIAAHIIKHWAVVLIAAGADEAETAAVQRAASRAAGTVVGTVTEMGTRIGHAPHVMVLKADDPEEQVLLWSLGLLPEGKAGTQVAILYGMGRRLGKTLSAAEATQAGMVDRFKLLGRNCTCTSDPSWLLGPAAPLLWDENLRILTREALGFDPNSPSALMTLAGAWKSLRTRAESGDSGAMPLGSDYIEFPAEPEDPDAAMGQDGVPPPLGAPRTDVEQEGFGIVWKTVAGLAAVSLVGGAAIIIRARRNT